MKVRAKQDGHYGGYYRVGPHESPQGDGTIIDGEVFEIDATPHLCLDESKRPIQEMAQTGEINPVTGQPILRPVWILDGNGKPKRDKDGNMIPKNKMATFFSPEWMEPVNDDATVTYPDQVKPLGVIKDMLPKAMQTAKNITARPVSLPPDVAAVLAGTKAESPI